MLTGFGINQKWLICHKAKPNQTKPKSRSCKFSQMLIRELNC